MFYLQSCINTAHEREVPQYCIDVDAATIRLLLLPILMMMVMVDSGDAAATPSLVSLLALMFSTPPFAAPPPSAQALARAAIGSNAVGNAVGKAETTGDTEAPAPASLLSAPEAATEGGDTLVGAPPPGVAVALRAESASEGRRDVVRAMFEVAWWPMLGAFSQVRAQKCGKRYVAKGKRLTYVQ